MFLDSCHESGGWPSENSCALSYAEGKNHCQDNTEHPGDLLHPMTWGVLTDGVCLY